MENKIDLDELTQRLRMMRNAAATEAADTLSQLQAENAELRQENKRLLNASTARIKSNVVIVHHERGHLVFRGTTEELEDKLAIADGYSESLIAELRRELEEARKDAERLDFIDAHGCDWDGLGAYIGSKSYSGGNLRECIDSAHQQQGDDAKR